MEISHKAHLRVAFFLWAIVGTGLLSVGSHFIWGVAQASPWADPSIWMVVAVVLGYVKGKFVITKVGRRNVARIFTLPDASPLYRTFSVKSWMLVLLMIAIGRTIRFFGAPPMGVGVIYVAVGVALLIGSQVYLSSPSIVANEEAIQGRSDPS